MDFLGARRLVDVIDVNTQQALELTLQNWVKYFTNPDRKLIYNVISLEFSHTKLQDIVESPSVVRFHYKLFYILLLLLIIYTEWINYFYGW